jgi:hypothetical protein
MSRAAALTILAFALAATACGVTTEVTPVVEGRVAHAIPAGPGALVTVGGLPVAELQPLQHGFFPVVAGHYNYQFIRGGDTLALQVNHARDLTAVILLQLDGPLLRAYSFDRNGLQQRLAVINGHHAAGVIDVVVTTADTTFAVTLPPGEGDWFDPPTGTFQVRVQSTADEQPVQLEPFSLIPGDHGFLVVIPGTGPDQPHRRLLF